MTLIELSNRNQITVKESITEIKNLLQRDIASSDDFIELTTSDSAYPKDAKLHIKYDCIVTLSD